MPPSSPFSGGAGEIFEEKQDPSPLQVNTFHWILISLRIKSDFLQSSKSLTNDFDLVWNCLSPQLPPLSSSHTGLLSVYQICSLSLALSVPGALPCCLFFAIQMSSNVASSVRPFPNHAFPNSIFQYPNQSCFLYSHLFYFHHYTSLCLELIN